MALSFAEYLTESQQRIDAVKAKFIEAMTKSMSAHYKEGKVPQNAIDMWSRSFSRMVTADPTNAKIYLQWMTNMYVRGINAPYNHDGELFVDPERMLEDLPKIREGLVLFDKFKQRITDPRGRDINAYKTYNKFLTVVEPFEGEKTNNELKREEIARWKQQITTVYDGPQGKIYIPHTEDASRYLGRNTKWCTAYTDQITYFNSYNAQGPLYVLITPQGKKYQIHFESKQFMDERDYNVSKDDHVRSLPIVQHFSKLMEQKAADTMASVSKDIVPEFVDAYIKFFGTGNILGRHIDEFLIRRINSRPVGSGFSEHFMELLFQYGPPEGTQKVLLERMGKLITTTDAKATDEFYQMYRSFSTQSKRHLVAPLIVKKITSVLTRPNILIDKEFINEVFSGRSLIDVFSQKEPLDLLNDLIVRLYDKFPRLTSLETTFIRDAHSHNLIKSDIATIISNRYYKNVLSYVLSQQFVVELKVPGIFNKFDMNTIIRNWIFPKGVYVLDIHYDSSKASKVDSYPYGFSYDLLTPEIKGKIKSAIRRNLMPVINAAKHGVFIENMADVTRVTNGWFPIQEVAPELTAYASWTYHYANEHARFWAEFEPFYNKTFTDAGKTPFYGYNQSESHQAFGNVMKEVMTWITKLVTKTNY